jgi:hypothetical protein
MEYGERLLSSYRRKVGLWKNSGTVEKFYHVIYSSLSMPVLAITASLRARKPPQLALTKREEKKKGVPSIYFSAS